MSNTIEALREAWYVIAQQAEVTDRPFQRTLLGESVVLWRAPDGSPRAAANGCPHRLAPLHLGRTVAGTLECPYHGLRFDESGHCVFNPHGKGAVPSGARLRLYPTARHAGWVWVWMGALPPDAAALPQIEFLVPSAQRRWVSGCISVRANYRHVIDNAMDPAHIGTVHRESLHSEGLAKARPKVSREAGGSVLVEAFGTDTAPPPALARMWQLARGSLPPRVDHWAHARWYPSATVTNDVGITPVGAPPEEGMRLRLAFAFTPETDSSTHYFWSICRDFLLGDASFDETLASGIQHVVQNEDAVILNALQESIGSADILGCSIALLAFDEGVVTVRKALDTRIAAERNCAHIKAECDATRITP